MSFNSAEIQTIDLLIGTFCRWPLSAQVEPQLPGHYETIASGHRSLEVYHDASEPGNYSSSRGKSSSSLSGRTWHQAATTWPGPVSYNKYKVKASAAERVEFICRPRQVPLN